MSSCLLADIGGTHARLAVPVDGQIGPIYRLWVGMYHDATQAIRHFLKASTPAIDCAIIAAAGPVAGGRCKLTNADWALDSDELKGVFGLRPSTSSTTSKSRPGPFRDCRRRTESRSVAAMPWPVSPWRSSRPAAASASPASSRSVTGTRCRAKVALAATDSVATSVIALLQKRYGHVSAERVLSGGGLVNLQQAIAELKGRPTEAPRPELVTQAGMDGSCAS